MKIAIIPARGGSKRIPRKNIKTFNGKPMLAYAIDAARSSDLFDRIIVSTDDVEIAQVALRHGAEVPFLRSAENANDSATTMSVLKEVLMQLDSIHITSICCIYPCVPLLDAELLTKAYASFESQRVDTLLPVIRYTTPIQRALQVKEGRIYFMYPKTTSVRTQDLETAFHDAGMFYWTKPDIINSYDALFTENTGFIEVTEFQAQDIDSETDWQLAEFKYAYVHRTQK